MYIIYTYMHACIHTYIHAYMHAYIYPRTVWADRELELSSNVAVAAWAVEVESLRSMTRPLSKAAK
jgi:hypothetical protein